MVETNPIATEPGEPQGTHPEVATEPQPTDQTGPDGTDWKAEARKWEARAKRMPKPAEDNGMAEKLAGVETMLASMKEKADALEAKQVRAEAVAAAAKEQGVDVELLSAMAGSTPEQISANAALLKSKIAALPVYPSVLDAGSNAGGTVTRENIRNIKSPIDRINAMAKNASLFKD